MSAGEPGPPYRLSMNEWTRDAIRRLFHRSVVVGARTRFARAMAEIETALLHSPTTWGQPLETYAGLRLRRYRRVYDELVVEYVVHLDVPAVWLTGVAPTRRHPMWVGEG